ncbi:MAG: pyruvate kinase [Methyloligellaceae bacterium]
MRRERQAKIVATLGPASSDYGTIKAMVTAGADVVRLNFSHGSQQDHRERYDLVRTIETELQRPIGILQDLQGPKFRIGKFDGGKTALEQGQAFRLDTDSAPGSSERVMLNHLEVYDAISPGDLILIDDGRLRLRIKECGSDYIVSEVVNGGTLSDNKGVNLPGVVLDVSPLTEKDKTDLNIGLDLGVDWIALSFVQRPEDVLQARDIIGDRAGIMAKIEKPSALERFDDILKLVDAIMVARGDLGVEIPPEKVPGWQKELIRACRLAGKPVIVATQMLESMISSPAPTRAEASDVATAVFDGADAVMLSAESAMGAFPIEAISMMDRIIQSTEQHHSYRSIIDALQPHPEATIAHAVAASAAHIAALIKAAAIISFTSSGTTAARVARERSSIPIISATPALHTARRLALLWGSHSVHTEMIASFEEMAEVARRKTLDAGFAKHGDVLVITAGIPFGVSGSANMVRVVDC